MVSSLLKCRQGNHFGLRSKERRRKKIIFSRVGCFIHSTIMSALSFLFFLRQIFQRAWSLISVLYKFHYLLQTYIFYSCFSFPLLSTIAIRKWLAENKTYTRIIDKLMCTSLTGGRIVCQQLFSHTGGWSNHAAACNHWWIPAPGICCGLWYLCGYVLVLRKLVRLWTSHMLEKSISSHINTQQLWKKGIVQQWQHDVELEGKSIRLKRLMDSTPFFTYWLPLKREKLLDRKFLVKKKLTLSISFQLHLPPFVLFFLWSCWVWTS